MAKDQFIKFEGDKIKGDSTVENREDWHDLDSFSLNFTNPGSMTQGYGGSRGAPQAGEASCSMRVDVSFVGLFKGLTEHVHFDKVEIESVKGTGEGTYVWLKHTLERVVLTGLYFQGSNEFYTCNFNLNFAKYGVEVEQQKDKGIGEGKLEAEYDFARETSG